MSKCVRCGRELTTGEPIEMYNGMCFKCYKEQNYAESLFKQGINDYQRQIDQLKQQLKDEQNKSAELVSLIDAMRYDDPKINELEKQLAEYESKENNVINNWDEMLKNCEECKLKECIGCEHTWTCVQDIKQQLSEKDKEIENCKRNELYEENMKILAVKNQTQLAIQELEKVKKAIVEESRKFPIVYDISDDLVGGAVDKDKVFAIIDQQIKELKSN